MGFTMFGLCFCYAVLSVSFLVLPSASEKACCFTFTVFLMSGDSQRSVILYWEDRAGCFTFTHLLLCSTYCVFSGFVIIFIRKRKLVAFLLLSS